MSITVVGPTHPYKGGIAQHTTELARRLQARGDNVEIQSWRRQYPERWYPGVQRVDEPDGVPFGSVTYDLSWNRPDTWWRVGRRAGRRSELVVIALVSPVQFPAYEVLARAARQAGGRVIAIAHNTLPHEATPIDRTLAGHLYRRLDAMVVHSQLEQTRAIELQARRVRVAQLPSHFEVDDTEMARDASRKDQLAFVGFVRPYKGLDLLLEALQRSRTRPCLVVRGEFWDDVERYRTLAKSLGIEDRCHLLPGYASPSELLATIDSSDALVLPYRSATGSQMPRMARSRGVPCIVTDVGDLASQIRDGLDGFVVRPDDADDLARAIDQLYGSSTLADLARTIAPVNVDEEWVNYLAAIDECMQA